MRRDKAMCGRRFVNSSSTSLTCRPGPNGGSIDRYNGVAHAIRPSTSSSSILRMVVHTRT